MKLLLTYLIIGFLASNPAEEKKVKQTISGTITASGSYCGGVAPSNEMLQNAQAKRPMSGFMVYVKKGTENNTLRLLFFHALSLSLSLRFFCEYSSVV